MENKSDAYYLITLLLNSEIDCDFRIAFNDSQILISES